jgi:signal transduction histidine kinase
MSDVRARSPGDRVLLLALTAKDAATTHELLATAGIEIKVCTSFESLLTELASGAAVLCVAEERMSPEDSARLGAVLREQPPWSDLPVLLLTRHGADSPVSRDAVRTLGNVTLLERPLRVTALLSAVRSAVRARQRQYQIRSHLDERERAAEALRIADQRKDEFLATLGHELRNPLAPLLTGLHLLRMTANRDAGVMRITAVMERQLTHLVRLVDDLLEVSRITRGVIDVQREPLDLATLIRSALDTTRPMFESAGHQLTVDLPASPIGIEGDSVRLTQVFANLLTNAAKYTNAGGRIFVSARRAGDRAVVTVRDNGIGIPAAHLDSVFDMFMQVDRSNRRSQGGLGIGLTLVRSLVSMHGGTVQARSAGPGHGSEFVVTLPVSAEQAIRTDRPRSVAMFPPRRILVVDDNRDAAELLAEALHDAGEVRVAYDGPGALAVLSDFTPDVALLDLGLPVMDGFELARRIHAVAPDVQLVAVSGYGQETDRRRSAEAGFAEHLVKPVELARVRAIARGEAPPPA